ncbi:hypothetical protein [Flavobacterium sp.]|uniref:hypothetical protein n=1 Tax=Flavobacterium sp. TaxID=239 RepID=UPI0011F49399|nr:hypothetical protein [Flavobacterium sp.]RZJ72764.1 MAG: hypothetical protein EOO49_03755 [Flavobacterium sp.]
MTKNPKPLEFNQVYYIMASALEEHSLFIEDLNYPYFLKSVKKYVEPIADVLAFCLLPNEIYMIVAINGKDSLIFLDELQNVPDRIKLYPSRQFSNLFNSYSQATGKRYARTGGLFKRPFYRKMILTAGQLQRCIMRIHRLPVDCGYETDWKNYKWNSAQTFQSDEFSGLKKCIDEDLVNSFSEFLILREKYKPSGVPVF